MTFFQKLFTPLQTNSLIQLLALYLWVYRGMIGKKTLLLQYISQEIGYAYFDGGLVAAIDIFL